MTAQNREPATITLAGGPTTLIEVGGVRLLTDPTFDAPGEYPIGNRVLVKTRGPSLTTADLGPIDAVLLSHEQHPDNLDTAGRDFLSHVPLVLTTAQSAGRLGDGATALDPWQQTFIARPEGGQLRVTAVPAQHGPDGTENLTGDVTGFVISGDDLPTIYVSGDNASLPIVERIADRVGPIDIAVIFAGAARTPLLDAYLTLGSDQAAEAARILAPAKIVPAHVEGWAHLSEGRDTIPAAFEKYGVSDQLVFLEPGASATL